MRTLSSNGFSHDMQVDDVLDYLRGEMSESDYKDKLIIAGFYDEVERRVLDGAHFDTEAMGVDVEWSSWLADWIENNTDVFWWEGEPFVLEEGEQHPDADD